MDDGRRHGVGGITEEITMRDLKTSKRRGLVNKAKTWLRRPGTFKAASIVLNLINLVARVIDHFK
jgi:hypothetical protein